AALFDRAGKAGLFEAKFGDNQSRSANTKKISDLLDIDPDKKHELTEDVAKIRDLICDYIRANDPDIEAENSDLVDGAKLEYILSEIIGRDEVERFTQRSSVVRLPNANPESQHDEPLTSYVATLPKRYELDTTDVIPEHKKILEQMAKEEEGLEGVEDLGADDLASSAQLLVGLAVPSAGKKTLEALWTDFGPEWQAFTDKDEKPWTAALMASHKSETGLASNVVRCQGTDENGKPVTEHLFIIHDKLGNGGDGATLIVGKSTLRPALVEALEANGITYVNREDDKAKETITEKLGEFVKGKEQAYSKEVEDTAQEKFTLEYQLMASLTSHFLGDWSLPEKEEDDKLDSFLRQNLPHGMVTRGDYGNDSAAPSLESEEEKTQCVGNILAILTDQDQVLSKLEEENVLMPYIVTKSPDMESLKSTLRGGKPEEEQAKGRA
ncbi:MAG: hypothetical protein ACPG80_00750, partial [Rickettsiales bacterium]